MCKCQKNTECIADYILMSQSISALCTALPIFPGLFNSYSQCRWNWPYLFFLGCNNNYIKPQCQHTPPYLLPHLMISLCHCFQQHRHISPELGILMLLPPVFGSSTPELRPEDVSLDRLWQPKYQLCFCDASQHL